MTTIFEALRADHEIQRTLIDAVIETSGDSKSRRRFWGQLKSALSDHADAEERYFYAGLMQHEITQEMARHSVAEHKELDDLVEALDDESMDSAEWLKTAKQLRERLLHHLEEEEREIFQLAGKALSETEKREMGQAYARYMTTAQAA